ncbi:protein CREG2 [Bombina bombina]|uniref:protein CREG2 n=1 Tax=Bombina bombina TaxID=8345 RepID=UPI00235A86D0|nr:protein CREG2 [Bombina bombina]
MSVCCLNIKTTASAAWVLWLLWFNALLYAQGYVIVNSVSWSVTNEVEEELDSSSTEDALPALLEDTISMWKQSYPASAYKEDREMKTRPGPGTAKQISSPSRMFSYRRENDADTESPPTPTVDVLQHKLAKDARTLVHQSKWGFLATVSTMETTRGLPFGHVLLTSDGPFKNSTGIPLFYVTPKASFVSDLLKNSVSSLTFANLDSDICRKSITEPQDPVCATLTVTGQITAVPVEESDFAKKALFSRHQIMRKWSPNYNWLFLKMNPEHIYVTNCYGGTFNISLDDYYRLSPY